MKRYLIAAGIIIVLFLIVWVYIQKGKISSLIKENARNRENLEILQGAVQHYETANGEKVAEVYALNFTIKELQRFRAADAENIKQLKTRKRDPESVTSTNTETIVRVEVPVIDSVIVYRQRTDTLKCIEYHTPWTDISGCLNAGRFDGSVKIRDSLLIVETVRLKRFLGFLWKTKKVKDRKIDATSKNPDTVIKDLEFIKVIR